MNGQADFAARLLHWYAKHGRHGLPWQQDRSLYRVWVSEIMLQQTQVATVIPYYQRFIARFPDVGALADAHDDEVMRLWAGLGYYARARNMLRAARSVRDDHGGSFPETLDAVSALPGVGPSTAAAILALACDQRHPILDGNCRRVYARHAGIDGWPGARETAQRLWACAERYTPHGDAAAYTQAIMDLGATVCTRSRPACGQCPVAADCQAREHGLTAVLPAPRPRVVRPHREATVLVVRSSDGAFLLERRPPTGIWGGLWSLPEVLPQHAPEDAVALPTLRHAFTHFTLDIRPLLVDATSESVRDAQAQAWVAPDTLDGYGLPSPIRKILARIAG
ncbi:MAG: A/G-specific adenine glycosylase [Xanthomonadaceae bacterium]|nr:A/G-specific adenine glycosylase [Xanthomonadaceae bacterium]